MSTTIQATRTLILNLPKLGCGNWWIKITTFHPTCIYYFGPFQNFEEAAKKCPDYVQNLIDDGNQKMSIVIKRCLPAELIKWDEDECV